MAHIEETIDVTVPVRVAYNQWTQFELFPRFMEGVKSVRQVDDQHLAWHAEVGGKELEWTAEITQQIPDQRIGWRSTSGPTNAGSVTFQPLGINTCRVTLRLEYEPDGFMEKAGSAIGVVTSRVRGDLERFKEFIEIRSHETGAWRGEVEQVVS